MTMNGTDRNTVERTMETMLAALKDNGYARVEVGDDRHRMEITKRVGSTARSRFRAQMFGADGSLVATQNSLDRVEATLFAATAGYGIRLQADDVVSYFGPDGLSVMCGLRGDMMEKCPRILERLINPRVEASECSDACYGSALSHDGCRLARMHHKGVCRARGGYAGNHRR